MKYSTCFVILLIIAEILKCTHNKKKIVQLLYDKTKVKLTSQTKHLTWSEELY